MSTPARAAHRLLADLPNVVQRQIDADGVSQRALCQRIGLPRATLSAVLSGADVKLSTIARLLDWLDRDSEHAIPDDLTPAARDVLRRLLDVDGLGQCWLRIERRGYGLLVPDGAGTLGELSRVRGLSWPTWGELEARGLVARRYPISPNAVHVVPPESTPQCRAPRNRRQPDLSWPVVLVR